MMGDELEVTGRRIVQTRNTMRLDPDQLLVLFRRANVALPDNVRMYVEIAGEEYVLDAYMRLMIEWNTRTEEDL